MTGLSNVIDHCHCGSAIRSIYRRMVLSSLLLGMIVFGKAAGQILPDSLVDHRIRIQLARQDRSLEGFVGRQALRGTLTRIGRDSLTILIHPETSPVMVGANGIYQIDVSRGVSRSRTAIKTALASAVYFSALGAISDKEWGGGSTENRLIWAGGGLVIGAVLGAILPQEQWKRVFRR